MLKKKLKSIKKVKLSDKPTKTWLNISNTQESTIVNSFHI